MATEVLFQSAVSDTFSVGPIKTSRHSPPCGLTLECLTCIIKFTLEAVRLYYIAAEDVAGLRTTSSQQARPKLKHFELFKNAHKRNGYCRRRDASEAYYNLTWDMQLSSAGVRNHFQLCPRGKHHIIELKLIWSIAAHNEGTEGPWSINSETVGYATNKKLNIASFLQLNNWLGS